MEADQKLQSLRTITTGVYALQAAGFFTGGLGWIVAIVIDYVRKDDAAGTPYETHFRWQIRTFWFGLLWGAIAGVFFLLGFLTLVFLVGFPILGIAWLIAAADAIWIIYRIVKGWLNLSENRPMPR